MLDHIVDDNLAVIVVEKAPIVCSSNVVTCSVDKLVPFTRQQAFCQQ